MKMQNIEIVDFEVSSEPFQLKKVGVNTDLTTGVSDYARAPLDGGIKVIPKIKLKGIDKGFFFITQICKSHKFEISTDENKTFKFEFNDSIHKDTFHLDDIHYKTYSILKNEFITFNKCIEFWDAPFVELCHNWKNVIYEIQFETWFQYQIEPENQIRPILSFNWLLECEVTRENGSWEFISNDFSSVDQIKNSIKKYNDHDKSLQTLLMPQLFQEVKDFKVSEVGLIKKRC